MVGFGKTWVGCGAVAWGIVYAYWDSFKGKSNLFGSVKAYDYSTQPLMLTSSVIKKALIDISNNIYSVPVTDGEKMTLPSFMENGTWYARTCGYTATCSKYNGSEYSKFDNAKSSLDNNRPCILLINAYGIGIVNHYVVIEAARKSQTKYAFAWHDRNVYYRVNYGWGDVNKEICVRDWGGNQNDDIYTATSLYTISVQ